MKLEQLYLYSNRIRRLENLDELTKLRILWLSDNKVSLVENLSALTSLLELNLARNNIRHVGETLISNSKLRSVNLADNPISSFREISYLGLLRNLNELCFADPDWGICPLTTLCNYQTFALFAIPSLRKLDTIQLDREIPEHATRIYAKKDMFYNMRAQTFQNELVHATRKATTGRTAVVNALEFTLAHLMKQRFVTAHTLESIQKSNMVLPYSPYLHLDADSVREKHARLTEAITCILKDIDKVETEYNLCKSSVYCLSNIYLQYLESEQNTGGNVSYEFGHSSDIWHMSCVDLINSRFSQHDYQLTNNTLLRGSKILGVRVETVTRIHNCHQRNRFDQLFESLINNGNKSCGCSVEYVFVGDDPKSPGYLLSFLENGTKSGVQSLSRANIHLTLSSADLPRIFHAKEAALKRSMCETRGLGSALSSSRRCWARGQVLIVKVIFGKNAPSKETVLTQNVFDNEKCLSATCPNLSESLSPSCYCVNKALVLPEYLVDFEYVTSSSTPVADACAPDNVKKTKSSAIICDPLPIVADPELRMLHEAELMNLQNDFQLIIRPIASYLVVCVAGLEARFEKAHSKHFSAERLQCLATLPCSLIPLLTAFTFVLFYPSSLPYTKLLNMDESVLRGQVSVHNSLVNMTYLDLHGNSIRKIEGLKSCCKLRSLNLSSNELSKIEGLECLIELKDLNLSFNRISRIEGVDALHGLHTLELNNNKLSLLQDLNVLKRRTPELVKLNLRGNPFFDNKAYRGLVLRRFATLKYLDGLPVREKHRYEALEKSSTLTPKLILCNSFSIGGKPLRSNSSTDDWWSLVDELVLEHQSLRRLQCLQRLTNLRCAYFRNNEIFRIEGLDKCTALEKLSFEGNAISAIDGLNCLRSLKELNLSENYISSIENISPFLLHLTRLSLENNLICSLEGISDLTALVELYIGNNQLSDRRCVQPLKQIMTLIILDLAGNPFCSVEHYRNYIIYHLRQVKVLDGDSVDSIELSAAKNRFGGRLTRELLEEKTGCRSFSDFTVLDLSRLRVRDIGDIFFEPDFRCLREINLNFNFVEDTSSLCALPNLDVLYLNGNKIGERSLWTPLPLKSSTVRLREIQPTLASASSSMKAEALLSNGGKKYPRHRNPFPSLTVLHLSSNSICALPSLRLNALGHLLRILNLANNQIQKIEGLEDLSCLEELYLDHNRIKYIAPRSFTGLQNIRKLCLKENGLKCLSHFSPLIRLESLQLENNRITELAEVVKLAAHPTLRVINLLGNPIGRKQVYRPMMLRHCRLLSSLDGSNINMAERDHVDYLFSPVDENAAFGQTSVGIPSKAHFHERTNHRI